MNSDRDVALEPQLLTEEERAYVLDRLDFLREIIEVGAPCVISNNGLMTTYGQRRVTHQVFTFFDEDWISVYRARRDRRTSC